MNARNLVLFLSLVASVACSTGADGELEPNDSNSSQFGTEGTDGTDGKGADTLAQDSVNDDTVETGANTADSDTGTTDGGIDIDDAGTDFGSWRFAVTADSRGEIWGINQGVLDSLVNKLLGEDIEMLLFAGDLVDGMLFLSFQLPSWLEAMEPLWAAGIDVYAVRGNHEVKGLNANALATWQNAFRGIRVLPDNGPMGQKKATYSVEHKNALIIGLDNYSPDNLVAQKWLDEKLGQKAVPHLFVFGHSPAFQAQHDDCLDDFPQKRDEFWLSLKAAGARVYFCGHDHFYDHAEVQGGDKNPNNDIHQYIVGSAGAEPREWSPPYDGQNTNWTLEQVEHSEAYGYVLVEVDHRDVTLTWTPLDGPAGVPWSYTVL